jgi:putative salt-induced outer membrane protein
MRTNGVTTAESYSAGYKAMRDFSARSYLFFSTDWRQDIFSGFDRQASQAVGYGRRLIDTERQMLSVEGGAGAKQSDLITGEELDEAIVRGTLDYLLNIGDNSQFNQKFLIEQGDDNRYIESTSALKARIVGNIALVFSIVIKDNSDVPVGFEDTDRFTAVSLEYAF